MIEIDGSAGEGGGQILRTALALSMCTGRPFTLTAPAWKCTVAGVQVSSTSHRGTTGAMEGGNFLFEDGHVSWYKESAINVGSQIGGWLCFYNIQ